MPYKLRDDNIIWDAMSPQDIVIADLQKGRYTTLSGPGSEFFWNLLINQISIPEVTEICSRQFNQFNEKDEQRIKQIVVNLVESELLIKIDQPDKKDISSILKNAPSFESFQVNLTLYDDMQTLLQLDPIDSMLED